MRRLSIFIAGISVATGLAAQNPAAALRQKYDTYRAVWQQPNLWLTFNQSKYSPGDTAWFKARFFSESMTPMEGQQVIELNLVDAAGQSKVHSLFAVNEGSGYNQVVFPQLINPGKYIITAHSSWMKNFGPGSCFQKEIEIVGKHTITDVPSAFVEARPEGGHLVAGIPAVVAVRSSANTPVQLVDAAGLVVSQVVTGSNGFGLLLVTPASNTNYFVSVSDNMRVPMPAVEAEGYGLHLIPARGNTPARVQFTRSPGSLGQQEVVVLVSSRGKVRFSHTVIPGDPESEEIEIPSENLSPGIAHLSLLSSGGEELGSRDFYHRGTDSLQVVIQTEKPFFQTREKVAISVSLLDSEGKPVEGEFSISVLNQGLFESTSGSSPHMPGRNDLNAQGHPAHLSDLDCQLMLTTAPLPWREILAGTRDKPLYDFTRFVQKRGKAFYADNGKPITGAQVMFYLKANNIRHQTTIDKGNVWLPLNSVYGEDELLSFAETFYFVGGEKHGEEIPDLKIEWEKDETRFPAAVPSRETDQQDPYGTFTANARLIEKSFGFYDSKNQGASGRFTAQHGSDFEDEIGDAGVLVRVQDYVLFPTMAELIKEVIPSLFHRKSGKKEIVRVALPDRMWAKVTGDPVYVIDGNVTKNTAFFLALKPADLLTVQVVNDPRKLEPLGMLGENGIVIVKTKKGDMREPFNPADKVEGLRAPLNFARLHASERNLNWPVFRSTLHWDPSVKTDANGKAVVAFFCTDDVGMLSIRIDGFTKGGVPFSAVKQAEVKLQPGH